MCEEGAGRDDRIDTWLYGSPLENMMQWADDKATILGMAERKDDDANE